MGYLRRLSIVTARRGSITEESEQRVLSPIMPSKAQPSTAALASGSTDHPSHLSHLSPNYSVKLQPLLYSPNTIEQKKKGPRTRNSGVDQHRISLFRLMRTRNTAPRVKSSEQREHRTPGPVLEAFTELEGSDFPSIQPFRHGNLSLPPYALARGRMQEHVYRSLSLSPSLSLHLQAATSAYPP